MSRELDFIVFMDELAKKEGRERAKPTSNREFIENAIRNIDKYPDDKDILLAYKYALFALEHTTETDKRESISKKLRELEERLQNVIDTEKLNEFHAAMPKAKARMEELKILYDNQKKEQQAYVYDTAANGIEVRIPLDQYENWKAAQDRIRRGEKSVVNPETVKQLAALMKGETTSSKEPVQNPPQSDEKEKLTLWYIIKAIAGIIFGILFGLMSLVVTFLADSVEEKTNKICKVLFLIFYFLVVLEILIFAFIETHSILLVIFLSSALIPLESILFFYIAALIYLILFFVVDKIKSTPKSSIVAFVLTLTIVFGSLNALGAYFAYNYYSEQNSESEGVEDTLQDKKPIHSDTEENNTNPDYDRIEPSVDYDYYILNTKTKKYHVPSCSYLPNQENSMKIKREKIKYYTEYIPCQKCL